jgi:hypothetical protein
MDTTWYVPETRKIREAELAAETAQMLSSIAPGHIYVIGFTSGVVKVGKTANPKHRLANHAMLATVHAVGVAHAWMSRRIFYVSAAERELIAFCARTGELAAGREYFRVQFSEVRNRADLVAANSAPYEEGSEMALLWDAIEPGILKGAAA